ncbi:MAG: EamA family transporter [Sphingobacteriales bacterium]|nr:EamA family transporter [Sphingobacteriales bacterium]
MSDKAKGLIAALSANIIWGFVSLIFRALINYPTELILTYRIIIAFMVTWLFIAIYKRKQLIADLKSIRFNREMPKVKFWMLLVLSGIGITGNWFAFIYVVNHINIKSGAFAYMICPLITALGGFILLKEELSRLKFFALALTTISIAILATEFFGNVLWSALIASFYATFMLIQRILKKIDRLNMLGFQLLIGLILVIPLMVFHPQAIPVDFSFWALIFVLALLFTLIPLLLSLFALGKLPSSTVGILLYINPIVAFSIAFFYFHEPIVFTQLLAYALLLVAVVVFNWKILKEIFMKKLKRKNEIDIAR